MVEVLVRKQRAIFTLSERVWLNIEADHAPRRGRVLMLSTVGHILQQNSNLEVINQGAFTGSLIPKADWDTFMVDYLSLVCLLVSLYDRCRGQVIQIQTVGEAILGEELEPLNLSFVEGFVAAHHLHTVVACAHLVFVGGLLPEVHLIFGFVQSNILHVVLVRFVLIGPITPVNQVEVPKHCFLVGPHPIDHDRDPLTFLVVSGLVARLYERSYSTDKRQS